MPQDQSIQSPAEFPVDFQTLYQSVLDDPSVSYNLKRRLAEDLQRDPVDALGDAELLQHVLQKRLEHTFIRPTMTVVTGAAPVGLNAP